MVFPLSGGGKIMAHLAGTAYHPLNGDPEDIMEGFCWSCLLFGSFWYMHKRMWGWAVGSFILAFITFSLSWFVLPFFANAQFANHLRRRGYLTDEQWKSLQADRRVHVAAATAVATARQSASASVADELSKLASLRESGVLTEDEFQAQKRKLLV